MRECAVRADFDSPAFLLVKAGIARAVLEMVQRAVAEETVHLINAFVAWVVFAVSILEIFMRVLHDPVLPFCLVRSISACAGSLVLKHPVLQPLYELRT